MKSNERWCCQVDKIMCRTNPWQTNKVLLTSSPFFFVSSFATTHSFFPLSLPLTGYTWLQPFYNTSLPMGSPQLSSTPFCPYVTRTILQTTYSSYIMFTMKAASSSKMSVNNYQSTCHHIPEDSNDHNKTYYEKYAQCNNSGAFNLFCSTISKTVTLPRIKYWT